MECRSKPKVWCVISDDIIPYPRLMPPSRYTDEEEGVALLSNVDDDRPDVDADAARDDDAHPPTIALPGSDAAAIPLRGRSQAEPAPPPADPRFDRPAPSPWKRAALLLTIALLFWLALHMKSPKGIFRSSKQQTVVYSNRYSKEYQFRPAASPIITQTMKDGRLEVHGAAPTKNVAAHASPEEKEMKGKGRARTPGVKEARKPGRR
ncbi:Casein kinase I isoform alpha [Mycena kentingensis (nom. inval.)]|nr:Casein kinase I isoform alpha [Mycena kentingensis (nom. inval.)]